MNIYFSGIGGVGIGPLAEIALDAGYSVQGSDMREGPLVRALRDRSVAISIGQNGDFLQTVHDAKPVDWFVHTSALPANHPELLLAKKLGIKTAKRDELIAYIIREKNLRLIAVAGTHGKTTTTGILVWTLQQLGIPVSYSVGATLGFGQSGTFDPASKYFVYECDEFDRNFLHFSPHLSLITSIDYDHPDTYPTKESYLQAFRQFIDQSDAAIMWQTDGDKVAGTAADGWMLRDSEVQPMQLPGAHNRRNATLVMKAIEYLALADTTRTTGAIATFPGTDRRFERLADNLYSDYGHHPVEIAATLQMARELSDHVVLVYQPHQNVRQHEIKDDYTTCFEAAEKVYWLPTYLSREDPALPILTPDELSAHVTNKSAVQTADLDDALWNAIQQERDKDKLVLVMGAGSIDGWIRSQLTVKQVANVLVVDTNGNYVLQKRDDIPTINNPGMSTAFGGSVEDGETLRQAATRELHEETNITFDAAQLNYHATLFQPLVNDGTSRWVTYFTLSNVPTAHLKVYEGQGFAIVAPDDDLSKFNLSPMARQAIDLDRRH